MNALTAPPKRLPGGRNSQKRATKFIFNAEVKEAINAKENQNVGSEDKSFSLSQESEVWDQERLPRPSVVVRVRDDNKKVVMEMRDTWEKSQRKEE